MTETDDKEKQKAAMDAWDIAQILWGTSVYPLLLQNQKFAEFSDLARKAQSFVEDGATAPVRNFLAKLKSATGLGPLFEKLDEIKTVDQLRQIGDERLQDLAGRLIGMAFDKIENSKLNDALKDLQNSLNKIEDFKNAWYERIKKAVNDKVTFDLHYAYTQASHDHKLIERRAEFESGRRSRACAGGGGGRFFRRPGKIQLELCADQ